MKYYVAYGSNMNKVQMGYRCPSAVAVGTGELDGYTLTFRGRRGSGVANVERQKGSKVPVAIWTITKACEAALDRYEGFPFLYIKKNVKVRTLDREIEAMVYVMRDGHPLALPSDYYYGVIEDGYMDFGLETPPLKEALERTADEIAGKHRLS